MISSMSLTSLLIILRNGIRIKLRLGMKKTSHVAEQVNDSQPHPASLSVQEILELLRSEIPHDRFAYY